MELDFAIPCPLVRPRMPYPISVRQVAALLHTSFRRHLAMTPLCFASPSPPSGWTGDFHSPAIEHAGHTRCPGATAAPGGAIWRWVVVGAMAPPSATHLGRPRGLAAALSARAAPLLARDNTASTAR